MIELATLWTFSVVPLDCSTADGNATVRYLVLDHGRLVLDRRLKMTFDVISMSLGFVVPIGVLVFCNSRLICSLRQSYHMARMYRTSVSGRTSRGVLTSSSSSSSAAQSAEIRLTLTLVCIVVIPCYTDFSKFFLSLYRCHVPGACRAFRADQLVFPRRTG